jgi:hypothetical protein
MLRPAFPALAILILAGPTPTAAEPQASMAVVQGLAEGDMLNVRASASPTGRVAARLPNGTALKKLGCDTFKGYEWCEVQDIANPQMRGWAPARYLLDAGPVDAAAPAMATGTTGNPQEGQLAVPPNLAARFGEAQPAPADDAEEKSAAIRKAMQDAYGTAPAAEDDDASLPDDGIEGVEADSDASSDEATTADVPVPTPRPGEATDAATMVARAEEPALSATGSPAPAGGDIPCARYVGQPMTRCTISVAHKGEGAADVTVTWPDGGTRIINFRDREPAGSDSTGEFRFTREGTLNMIRIGQSERFEITDALSFGK